MTLSSTAWEEDIQSALQWCGNFHPGANGKRPGNILSCGGAVCILFGGMRLLTAEEKKRSAEMQAEAKEAREEKKRKAKAKEAKESKKSKKNKTKRQQPSARSVAKFLECAEGAAQARALPA